MSNPEKDIIWNLLLVDPVESTSGFMPFYIKGEVTTLIHPDELQDTMKGKIEGLPENWTVGTCLFDGDLVFDDINEMLKAVRDFTYLVELNDLPLKRQIGFKCTGELKRSWHIGLIDLKKSKVSK